MNYAHLLHLLRWDIDHLAFLGEYNEYYWLKPSLNKEGERIGITSCCQLDYECEKHKQIRNKVSVQNSKLN